MHPGEHNFCYIIISETVTIISFIRFNKWGLAGKLSERPGRPVLEVLSQPKYTDRNFDNTPDLEYLMRRYGDQVLRLAYSYLRDVEEAKDAAQEVFLRVFTSLPKFKDKSMPYTWIYRVTVNLCRDRLRKKHRFRWEFLSDYADLVSSFNTEKEALTVLEEKALFEAVMSLPVKFREVIVLYYLYQFNTKKIAEITGTNQALVKTRLYRGRQKLKQILIEKGVVSNE